MTLNGALVSSFFSVLVKVVLSFLYWFLDRHRMPNTAAALLLRAERALFLVFSVTPSLTLFCTLSHALFTFNRLLQSHPGLFTG